MGAYLSQPNLYKESVDGENQRISYGASSMQGWRLSQEDAHNSIVDFDLETNTSFFSVYDGHGGPEVAAYCAKYLPDYLKKLKEYENANLEESLKTLFLKFDESLLTPEAQKELKELREEIENNASNAYKKVDDIDKEDEDDEDEGEEEQKESVDQKEEKTPVKNKKNLEEDEDDQIDDENDDENVAQLYDEATMPLEEVLKRYSNTENKVKKALKNKGVFNTLGRPSPMITAAGASGSGSSSSKLKKKQLKNSLHDLANQDKALNDLENEKPLDFQKQEEEDISEIKKNGSLTNQLSENVNSSAQNHDQDYDEASNLCDLTDSHKSITAWDNSNAGTTATSNNLNPLEEEEKEIVPSKPDTDTKIIESSQTPMTTTPIFDTTTTSIINNTNLTPNKMKLNKEELKLSPIRKKSLSSSSLLDDLSSNPSQTDTAVLNGVLYNNPTPKSNSSNSNDTNTNSALVKANEENKENDLICNNGLVNPKSDADKCENGDEAANSIPETAVEMDGEKKPKNKRKKKNTAQEQIARFIAGWVKQKKSPNGQFNKKDLKNLTKISNNIIKSKDGANEIKEELDDELEDEDDESEELDNEEDDEDNEDEEEADSEDDEDAEEDDDDDEDDSDDDDDDDDDYEQEEEDEDDEIDPNQGMETRPGLDSGCTAVVALLRENKHLYVANAGDSRCVVCREGKAIDMSIDHKPEDEEERMRIEKAGGQVTKDGRVNNGLNLSRAIGDHTYKTNKELPLEEQMITSYPDVRYLEIDAKKDSFMVLACDGIWNFMSSQDVCDYIQERLDANNGYSKLSQICEELFMHCLAPDSEGDGTGCDNMTCIIVTFNPFRKCEIKLNNPILDNQQSLLANETNNLKRSLVDSNNGTIEENEQGIKHTNSNTILKKLKSDETTVE